MNRTEKIRLFINVISKLSEKNGFTRIRDIAITLRISSSSVCTMVSRMKSKGLLSGDKYGSISVTLKGLNYADDTDLNKLP